MRRIWPILLFALIHSFIFILVFEGALWGKEEPGGSSLFFWYSSKILSGELPYKDFNIEYPPLSILVFLLPRLFARNVIAYDWAFGIEMLLFDLTGLGLIADLATRLGQSLWGTLIIYTLAFLAIGLIIGDRYDLVPAVIVLFTIYAFIRGWITASWVALALGMMTKIYPVVIVPLFVLYFLRHRNYSQIIKGSLIFVFNLIFITVPCLWLSPEGFWHFFSYHSARGLQAESTYASLLLLGRTLGITSVGMEFSFGSWNLVSPLADMLAEISPLLMALALVVVYVFYAGGQALSESKASIINYAQLTILFFLLTNKVLSPQFIIWLYPLIPLISGRMTYWPLFVIISLMTLYIFPTHYIEFIESIQGQPRITNVFVWVLVLRNLLLIIMVFLLLKGKK